MTTADIHALPAGLYLDCLVAEALGIGAVVNLVDTKEIDSRFWTVKKHGTEVGRGYESPWPYSTEWASAGPLLERLTNHYCFHNNSEWEVSGSSNPGGDPWPLVASGHTGPLTIARAAVILLGKEKL